MRRNDAPYAAFSLACFPGEGGYVVLLDASDSAFSLASLQGEVELSTAFAITFIIAFAEAPDPAFSLASLQGEVERSTAFSIAFIMAVAEAPDATFCLASLQGNVECSTTFAITFIQAFAEAPDPAFSLHSLQGDAECSTVFIITFIVAVTNAPEATFCLACLQGKGEATSSAGYPTTSSATIAMGHNPCSAWVERNTRDNPCSAWVERNIQYVLLISFWIYDAMGRWFCRNDTCVREPSVQAVLSEKAYTLFFARTTLRAGSSTSMVSTGVNSHDSHGNGAVENIENVLLLKAVNVRPSVESSLAKSTSMEVKIDKVSSSLQSTFNGLASSLFGKTSVSGNGQVNSHGIQPAEGNEYQGNLIHKENGRLSTKENGSGMNGKSDAVNSYSCHGLANGNGHVHDGVGDSTINDRHKHENNGVRATGKMSENGGYQSNGAVIGYAAASSLKQKDKDSFIFSEEDVSCHTTLEEVKEVLKKEATSALRSCGWTDDIYEYMRSNKRLQANSLASLTTAESKNLLIEDARTAFLKKVPPSKKQGLITLITCLRAFQ